MALILLVLVLHIVHLVVSGAVSPEAVVDIGCFSTGFANSNPYYKLTQGLPWDKGVAVCDEKLTKYVGVQAEPGWPGDNFIFCGNDLDLSVKVNSSECRPCVENATRQCGGQDTMSLYKLRDKTPFAVWLGTDSGNVEILPEGHERTIPKIHIYGNVKQIDYLYASDDIFVQDDTGLVFRSYLNHLSLTYKQSEYYTDISYQKTVYHIALNWQKKTLLRCETYNCYESDLYGANEVTVKDDQESVSYFKIDPQTRTMFYMKGTQILFSRPFDGRNVNTLSNYGSLHVTGVTCIAVDVQEQTVYVIGSVSGKSGDFLVKVDYEDKWAKVIFSGPELSNVQSLDVYDGEAVWINTMGGRSTVYRCTLSPTCKPEHLKVFYEPPEYIINDVKIYHPERQTPGKKNLCQKLMCSHGCERESLFVVKCSCPLGMDLFLDTHCIETQQNRGAFQGVNWPARKANSTTTSSGITKAKSSLLDSDEKTTTSHYGFFYAFQIITTLIVIAILVLIVYLMINFQNDKRNKPLLRRSDNNENDNL